MRVLGGMRKRLWCVCLAFALLWALCNAQNASCELVDLTLSGVGNEVISRDIEVDTNNNDNVFVSLVGSLVFERGQECFQLKLNASVVADVVVSTCTRSTFNTTLIMLKESPTEIQEQFAGDTLVNRFDPTCGGSEGIMRSTVEYRTVDEEEFLYLVVTGWEGAKGDATVSFSVKRAEPLQISWGLDRIDQRNLPRDNISSLSRGGDGVFVYVVDSGVNPTHSEFLATDSTTGGSRASVGKSFVADSDLPDCTGHGTHVAALIAGRTLGVAQSASIIAVKVLRCDNRGEKTALLAAIDWILEDIKEARKGAALVVMSVLSEFSEALNAKVNETLIQNDVPVVAAAGNFIEPDESSDSCSSSPGSLAGVISVSASTTLDRRAVFSKYGRCTDIYAPGVGILSAFHTGDYATRVIDGTSQASSFVAGAVARLLSTNPRMNATNIPPAILSMSTKDVLDLNTGSSDANRLLYVRDIPNFPVERPPQGWYHIYFGFQLSSQRNCSDDFNAGLASTLRRWLIDHDAPFSRARVFSCAESFNPQPGTSELLQDEYMLDVQFEVGVANKQSSVTFETINDTMESEDLQDSMSLEREVEIVAVAALPWVVDSRMFQFWAAPLLPGTSNTTSVGSIVGIVLASVTAFIALLLLLLLVFRWTKPAEREDTIRKSDKEQLLLQESGQSDSGFPPPMEMFHRSGGDPRPTSENMNDGNTEFDVVSLEGGEGMFHNVGANFFGAADLGDSFASIPLSNRSEISENSDTGVIDGPLRTDSFGEEAFLLGGGLFQRESFVDTEGIVEPAAITSDSAKKASSDNYPEPSIRMDSFEVFLDNEFV
ncbi:hypothetical protein NDN08_006075 [Rhodosorus marinus]|uniref:Peptidase S8/S53 domain-containing protein n=1 Tax=Rhodosorus marinus TaxID=101924 RepID=A0AAV8UJR2_9RHOD|nr:hypothetical protein NDN08_006075 [Rhodosorus marinus]